MTMESVETEPMDEAAGAPAEGDPDAAAQRLAELLSPERVDALLADAEASGLAIDGPDGLINQMIRAVLERALDVELADHLGYDRGDPAGAGSGNSRNGFTAKTVITSAGQTRVEVPRDRKRQLRAADRAQAAPADRQHLGHDFELVCEGVDDPRH